MGDSGGDRRRVRWFSAGAASAVATKLDLREHPGGEIAYCETGSEDEDNARFLADCVRWFNAPSSVLKRLDMRTRGRWEKRRFLSGVNGAGCTGEFKLGPRLAYQRPFDIHVFGYTADGPDRARADRLREAYPELTIITPLIERGIDKAGCLAMVISAGLRPPRTYAMGFPNANCIPCVKATSPDYWSLVRLRFPISSTGWRRYHVNSVFG